MRLRNRAIPRAALLLSASIMAGCADSATELPARQFSSGPSPLVCPTNESATATSTIGALGGTVSVAGTIVTLPLGAVLSPTTITVTVPASQYVEVDITANGEEHFLFETPITVTLSYSRCNRNNINNDNLSAWYWNPATDELLEDMGGIDNKLLRTVTFTTPHLSGYLLAN